MSIKPVLVPDHTANDLRRLMDQFAEATTGPTRQELTESRAAVAAAQGVAEGSESENLAIGQQMARDGIEYDPAREGEIISQIGDYLKRSGMTPRQIRGYMIDNDFVSDQLSYLPRKSSMSEGVAEGVNYTDELRDKMQWLMTTHHMRSGEAEEAAYYDQDPATWKGSPWEDEYTGVTEARPDVMRHKGDTTIRVVKRGGRPIGEIGTDAEASPGNGQYYVKLYDGSYDAVGFDSAEEALAELKAAIKSMSEGVANASEDPNLAKAYRMGNEAYKALKTDPARAQAAQDRIEAEFPQYLKMWTTGYHDGERFDKSDVTEGIDPVEQLRADILRFSQ